MVWKPVVKYKGKLAHIQFLQKTEVFTTRPVPKN